jgi:multiple antibiotic resistance protein
MLETAAVAFTTLFVTLGPIEAAAMFAALTQNRTAQQRHSMAVRATLVAAGILLTFAVLGDSLLSLLGISLAALKTAGGILLLLIGIDMVFARASGGTTTTNAETQEAEHKQDISVFPLATPLIAGPGAIHSEGTRHLRATCFQ